MEREQGADWTEQEQWITDHLEWINSDTDQSREDWQQQRDRQREECSHTWHSWWPHRGKLGTKCIHCHKVQVVE